MRPITPLLLLLLPLISALPAPQITTTTNYDPTTYYDPNVPTTDNLALPSTLSPLLPSTTPLTLPPTTTTPLARRSAITSVPTTHKSESPAEVWLRISAEDAAEKQAEAEKKAEEEKKEEEEEKSQRAAATKHIVSGIKGIWGTLLGHHKRALPTTLTTLITTTDDLAPPTTTTASPPNNDKHKRASGIQINMSDPEAVRSFFGPYKRALPSTISTLTNSTANTTLSSSNKLARRSAITSDAADPTPIVSSEELAELGFSLSDEDAAALREAAGPYERSPPSTLSSLTSTNDAAPTPTTTPSPLDIEMHKRAPSPVVLISVATLPCCDPTPTPTSAAEVKAKRDCISCETKVEVPGSFVATFQEVSSTFEEIFEDLLPNHSEKRDVAEGSGKELDDLPGHGRGIWAVSEDELDLMLHSTTTTSTAAPPPQSTESPPSTAVTGQLNGMIDEFPPNHSKREVAAGGASVIEGLSEEERKYLETMSFDDSFGDDLIVPCDSALSRSHREETSTCPASPPLLRRTTISDEYNPLNPLYPDHNPLNPLIKGRPTDATVRAASYARNYLFYAQFYLKKLQREAADAQRNVDQQVSLGRPAVREKEYLEKKKKAMVGFDVRVQHLAEEAERLSVAADGAVLGGTSGKNDEGFLGR